MDLTPACYSRNRESRMGKTLRCLCLCVVSLWPCSGWHHPVHQMMTRAAIASLPVSALVDQFYARIQERGGKRWDTSSLIHLLQKP